MQSDSILTNRMATGPDMAVVVPVHNALPYVRRTLTAIVNTYPDVPLVVVDDCSDLATSQWMSRFLLQEHSGKYPHSRVLLRNERQQLFTRTVNRGLRWAYNLRHGDDPLQIDFVAVVNSDCELQDGWLKALRLGMEDPCVGIVGFAEVPDGWEPAYRELREPEYVSGHCFLLRMQMLEAIGVLCETDTQGGPDSADHAHLLGQAHVGSDRALSWRANRTGWRTLYCHCLLCTHAGGISWKHDLAWLSEFDLQPLWPPCDHLQHPGWTEPSTASGSGRHSNGTPTPALTIMIPSISAPTLVNTLASIRRQELLPTDQVLVVGDGPQQFAKNLVQRAGPPFQYLEYGPEHDWGNPQRNFALGHATGDYLAWMDEDDIFMPGIFDTIRQVANQDPGRPMVFRFVHPSRHILWQQRGLIQRGQIGGHQFVTPNVQGKVGRWGSGYEADFDFIRSTLDCYETDNVCIWREEIIATCRPHLH